MSEKAQIADLSAGCTEQALQQPLDEQHCNQRSRGNSHADRPGQILVQPQAGPSSSQAQPQQQTEMASALTAKNSLQQVLEGGSTRTIHEIFQENSGQSGSGSMGRLSLSTVQLANSPASMEARSTEAQQSSLNLPHTEEMVHAAPAAHLDASKVERNASLLLAQRSGRIVCEEPYEGPLSESRCTDGGLSPELSLPYSQPAAGQADGQHAQASDVSPPEHLHLPHGHSQAGIQHEQQCRHPDVMSRPAQHISPRRLPHTPAEQSLPDAEALPSECMVDQTDVTIDQEDAIQDCRQSLPAFTGNAGASSAQPSHTSARGLRAASKFA